MPMTVEELSRRSGVAANTIRYYTRVKLLRPDRHPMNGYRLFDEADYRQLTFIVVAKQLGFSLAEIRRLIEAAERGKPTGILARRIVEQRVIEIRTQIEALRDLQKRMENALSVWDHVPDRVPDVGSICSVLELVSAEVKVPVRSRVLELGRRFTPCRPIEVAERACGD